jgi:hypothetical protein
MAFVQDFWKYCSCYEITRNNAIWTAFSVLGATVNRKVYTRIGEIPITCNLYTLLVSTPGTGKSTARSFGAKLFQKGCPAYQICASKQSHADIIKTMASGDCAIHYTDSEGRQQEGNVYTCFVDEFKNFIAYDPIGMLGFLTGIHSEYDLFDAKTLSRNHEKIPNPSFTFLGCENPDIFTFYIKSSMISDGFGRRVNIVYETEDAPPKPKPVIPPDVLHIYQSVLPEELRRVERVTGEYIHTPESQDWYNNWYIKNRKRMAEITEPVYQGWIRTMHIQLLKLAMLQDVSTNTKPSFRFSPELFEFCLAVLNAIEPNMPKLFAAGGKNELAPIWQKMVDIITSHGGSIRRKELERIIGADLDPMKIISSISHLVRVGTLASGHEAAPGNLGVKFEYLYTPEGYINAKQQGKLL